MARQRLPGEERSRAIVSAALGLYAREGFSGTTTRRIARAAGVSEALVFKHFPHKESLYRAILKTKIRDAERALPLDSSLLELSDEALLVRALHGLGPPPISALVNGHSRSHRARDGDALDVPTLRG